MLTKRVMLKKFSIFCIGLSLVVPLNANEYSFRKYAHVKSFYADLAPLVIEVSSKYKLPAASILAIAGLESGYGSGYVSQITGNILSLGAFKGDKELPSLYLPYSQSLKKVLFDPNEIKKHSSKDLSYKKRPKSLKRDYRPKPYAGTKNKLELLKYSEKLRSKAHKTCLNDFATRWIILDSNIKAFRNARLFLNKEISDNNIKILDSMKLNIAFINKIGGIPNSFNYRKTWPQKVKLIMNKVGLVALVDDMKYKKMSFNQAWENRK